MTDQASTVDAVTAAVRARVLDGALAAGERVTERDLVETYGVARHSARAALRALAAEGLLELIPNRGARVVQPDAEALVGLFELRAALEIEAARLALERDPDGLARELTASAARLRAACDRPKPAWSAIVDAHAALHGTIVEASGSQRIVGAHTALESEMRVFLVALRPVWTFPQMAEHHEALAHELPAEGPDVLREHLADGLQAVISRMFRIIR